MVADAGTTILPAVAHEVSGGQRACIGRLELEGGGRARGSHRQATPAQVAAAAQALDVVDMDVLAEGNRRRGPADRLAVLEENAAELDGPARKLMSEGNRTGQHDSFPCDFDRLAGSDIRRRHG